MFPLLSELTETFLPGRSPQEVQARNRLKGRSFEILAGKDENIKDTKWSPLDGMSVAAFELRRSGYENEGQRLEDFVDMLPKSAHVVLTFLFDLRAPPKEQKGPKQPVNPKSYPVYSNNIFIKSELGLFDPSKAPFSSASPSLLSVPSVSVSKYSVLVPIPPLSHTLNTEGQRPLRVPKGRTSSPKGKTKKDEGYTSSSENDPEETSFPWDDILSLEAPSLGLRRNWENLGIIDPLKELPYITEYSGGVLPAWSLAWNNIKLSNPQLTFNTKVILRKENEIIKDIGYLMMGIASRSFGFNASLQEFYITPGLCQENLTPESLANTVQEYVTCGTYFRRLERFVEKRNLLEGLIFQCFQTGVQNYLDGFRAMVLKIVAVKCHLLELSKVLRPLCKHVFFLAELCKVTEMDSKKNSGDPLPRGIRLLSHLFDMTYYVNTKDLYFVLISILRITAGPYFRFLERWVFEGVCHDDFSEFGLIENGNAVSFRDRRYWSHAYVVENMSEEDDSDSVAGASFISDIQKQIYQCGKALNFLKLCCSNHFLCCTTPESQPKIRLLVSLSEENNLKKEVRDYTELMNAIAKEKSISIKMHKEELDKQRRNLASIARIKHMETLKAIEKNVLAEKLKKDEKKRLIREDLQEQVRLNRKKREEIKNIQAKEDKEWLEKAMRKERESIRREELARKEIEEHYRLLSAAAERREKLAHWKLRRHALRTSRIKFWRAENEVFQNHKQNQLNNEESLTNSTNLNLPVTLKDTWKPLRVRNDDQNNIILDFEDSESNVLSVNVNNWSSFSTEEQSLIITTGNVSQLKSWMKQRLLENYPSLEEELTPVTTALDNATPKVETYACKDQKASSIVFEYETQANYSKKNENDAVKKKNISVVDGRKRPKSKRIEDVLYQKPRQDESTYKRPLPTEFDFSFKNYPQEYTKTFSGLFSTPIEKDFSDRLLTPKRVTIDSENPEATNLQNSSNTVIPLRILMENSILIPLRTQKNLVNQAALNYILVDAGLMSHFEACRDFILFHDGEFGHTLSSSIFNELSHCKSIHDLMNPATLNRLVDNAILLGSYVDSKTISNVGFKRIPPLNLNDPVEDVLSHLVLTYSIQWPYNVILTAEALNKYGEIFKFLLQLKRSIWALQQAYQNLNRLGKSYPNSHQLHRMHLMRHEMLNFVTVTEGYISTQVLDLCWQEFQNDLDNKVKSLDDLYEAHETYLNKALFRCLLNKKAKPVQKMIADIFSLIIKFSLTLASRASPVESDPLFFESLEKYFELFKERSVFLYQVVSKLAVRGYQHHLFDLMLRLNFSGFYQESE